MIRRLRARWQRFLDRLWWLYALLFPVERPDDEVLGKVSDAN